MSGGEKKKSRTVSFRVPENIIAEIEKEAKRNMTSTNVLINQILHQYVEWDRFEHRMKMFPIPEDDLHFVLGMLDDTKREEAINITFNSIRDWALITRQKFDIHTCLQVLEDYCRMVGFTIEENVSSGFRSYVIRHNMGKKISLFIEELAKKIFWELIKIKVSCETTNSTVIVRLQSKFD